MQTLQLRLFIGFLVCVFIGGCGGSGTSTKIAPAPRRPQQGTQLVFIARAGEQKVTAASLAQAITVMRKRVDALGQPGTVIRRIGNERIEVVLLHVSNAQRAQEEVGKTAQLYFYDWEPNVIGPDGQPAPTELKATGGQEAGGAATGLPEYEAVLRALKRPPILSKSDTTYSAGCTPKQENGCIYGQWYLLDDTAKKVLRGPEDVESNLYADNYRPPAKHKVRAVRVNPGTVLAQAKPIEGKGGKVTEQSPESWYVLNDNPALNGSEIKSPRQNLDNGPGGNGQPDVTFEFDGKGRKTFERVTKEIAERGQERQLPGVPKAAAEQHFAVVLDNQIITAPLIDYTANPEGIEAANGSQISGGFTLTSAQNLADELQSGALPIKLELISQRDIISSH